jgi:hypothetical protein
MSRLEEFSASHEAHRNREERRVVNSDVKAYLDLRQSIEAAADGAEIVLEKKNKHALDLVAQSKAETSETGYDATDELATLIKQDKEARLLVNQVMLKDHFRDLRNAISNYISAIHDAELYRERSQGEISEEVMERREELEKRRSAAHNTLIDQLHVIKRSCKEVGIDIPWLSMLQLNKNKTDDRQTVQRWAEHVADYLVSLSQTTEEGKK